MLARSKKHTKTKFNKPDKRRNKSAGQKKILRDQLASQWIYVILVLLGFVLYGNTIPNEYALDDQFVTNNNPLVSKGFAGIPDIFSSLYAKEKEANYGYRPIVQTTFAIENQFFGFNPHISHFINVLLYIFLCIMLFRMLKRLFPDVNIYAIFMIILLFIAHPVHTEVVASLKNRDEILAFLFGILCLWYFINYLDKGKFFAVPIALIFYFLAYLSKPSVVTFIFIIPLAIYFKQGFRLKSFLLVFTLLLIASVLAFYLPRTFLPNPERTKLFFENPLLVEENIFIRFSTGFYILLYYIKLLIFPHPLRYYYGYDMIPVVDWSNAWVIMSVIIYLALFFVALREIKKRSLLSFAILFSLLSIAVYSNFLTPVMGIVAERFMLIPSLGFVIIFVILIYKLFKTDICVPFIPHAVKYNLLLIISLITVAYSIKTITRNEAWENNMTLWEHDMKYLDNSAKANVLYAGGLIADAYHEIEKTGNINQQKSKIDLALKHFHKAVEIYPDYYVANNNIGSIYFSVFGEFEKSIPYFEKAIVSNPVYVDAYFNLAYSYEMIKNFEKAKENYYRAVNLKPRQIDSYERLNKLLIDENNKKEIIELNNKLAENRPDSDMPYVNLGNYYMSQGNIEEAIENFVIAVEKYPANYDLCMYLSEHFNERGETEKAQHYYVLAQQAK